jgi:hypothetical protein
MKSLKQTKILFGFGLSMMDKAIEMQNAKNKFQELKNEEIRLQSTQIKGEILELKSPLNEDEQIDEKLKSEVENDPLFKLFDDIFNPNKNKEIIDEIMKDKKFPSGGIIVEVGKLQDQKPTESDDSCPCEACVLRRTLEGKERGFND